MYGPCIIGASAVSLATAYAIGDVLSLRHLLHRKVWGAKAFYGVYFGLILVSAILVLTPGTPLGLLTNAVHALASVLLPSAAVFLLLLCNDRAVLGPWINSRWLNLFTGAVIAVLVMLSMILTLSVVSPESPKEQIIEVSDRWRYSRLTRCNRYQAFRLGDCTNNGKFRRCCTNRAEDARAQRMADAAAQRIAARPTDDAQPCLANRPARIPHYRGGTGACANRATRDRRCLVGMRKVHGRWSCGIVCAPPPRCPRARPIAFRK